MAERVLLVSTSTEVLMQRESWLQAAGFSIEAAGTFADARARLSGTPPDVLLTDVRLDGFNGLHLAIVGMRSRPTLVAIAVGAPDPALAKEAEHYGAAFLSEPVTRDELVARIHTALREHPKRHRADRAKRASPRLTVVRRRA